MIKGPHSAGWYLEVFQQQGKNRRNGEKRKVEEVKNVIL